MAFKFELEWRIGRYPIVRDIGHGATSRIYLGRDPDSGRELAIKVFVPEDPEDDAREARLISKSFLAESALTGRLVHPHIAQILDAGTEAGYRYVVMEYVEGATLETHCEVNRLLPLEKVIEAVFKCAGALDYALQHGVIHRDIKPGNILYSRDGEIKLTDFGSSYQTGRAAHTTQLAGVGSPAYMSPEQIRLAPLSHQTDIYSLGVVLYRLLTGRLPYAGDNPLSLTYEILNITPAPPSAYRPELPAILDRICLRAMDKSLERRYRSWGQMADDLAGAFGVLRRAHGTRSDSEKFALLRALAFFRDFDDVVLWEALRAGLWRELDAGTAVLREGEADDSLHILVAGEVEVSVAGTPLAVLKPGGCFGHMLYFEDAVAPRTTSVATLGAASSLQITAAGLRAISPACQVAFQRAFMRVLVERIARSERAQAERERAAGGSSHPNPS